MLILKKIFPCFHRQKLYEMRVFPRLETEHKESVETLRAEAKEQAQRVEKGRAQANKEHSAELARQRKELTEAAEQSENRLMKILDRERQEAKQATKELTRQFSESRDSAQACREKTIGLEASLRQAIEQRDSFADDLAEKAKAQAQLKADLMAEKDKRAALQREFKSYRVEHKISGDLEKLQTTIKALQKKIK